MLAAGLLFFAFYASSGQRTGVESTDLVGDWENDLPKFAKERYSTTLSIRSDGTFSKTETTGGDFRTQRTITYTGEYKTGNEELYGEFIHFFVLDANCKEDPDISKDFAKEGRWNFMCKYGFSSDGQLMLMDIFGNQSGLRKQTDDIFPSWEFYNRR